MERDNMNPSQRRALAYIEGKQLALALGRATRDGDIEGLEVLRTAVVDEHRTFDVLCGAMLVATSAGVDDGTEFVNMLRNVAHAYGQGVEALKAATSALRKCEEQEPEWCVSEIGRVVAVGLALLGPTGEARLRQGGVV